MTRHVRALLRHWFSFMGRMSRGDFNSVNIVALLLVVAANMVFVAPLFTMQITAPVTFSSIPLGWNAWVAGVLFVMAMWMAISSAVRRLHDFGWSGWWLALMLSPLRELAVCAGMLGMIILCLFRGRRRENAYGEKSGPNELV